MSGIALINPGVNYTQNLGLSRRFAVKVPPLGLAYMAAIMENRGESVTVIDQFAEGITDEELLGRIHASGADIIGLTLLTASATRTKRVCLNIRKNMPSARIILGNIHASIFSNKIIDEGWADAIVHGEGEYILPQLADAFRGKGSLGNTPSISFREDGRVHNTARAAQIMELDALPLPAWHLYALEHYRTHTILTYGKMTLPLITSRGCPWRCGFCSQNHFWDKVVIRNAAGAVEEMKRDFEEFECEHFAFHDANFPVTKKFGMEFCGELHKAGLTGKVSFVTEARIEVFDEELILALKKAGCRALMFGIESGSEKIRAAYQKNFSNLKVREIVRFCRENSIDTMGLFLIGLPEETREDFHQTMAFSRSLPLDLAKFNVVVPYPGSLLFEKNIDAVRLKDEDFDRIATFYSDGFSALTMNESMSMDEIDKLQKKALAGFFIRPKAIWNLLFSGILSWGDIAVGGAALVSSILFEVKRNATRPFRNSKDRKS